MANQDTHVCGLDFPIFSVNATAPASVASRRPFGLPSSGDTVGRADRR